MNGQFEQPDFNDVLFAKTGKGPVSITCTAILDEHSTLPNGTCKPCWCVSFLLCGDGFSISKLLQVGTSKGCEKEANQIAEKINKWYNSYKTLKEALKLCMPDQIDKDDLEDWQYETLKTAQQLIEED